MCLGDNVVLADKEALFIFFPEVSDYFPVFLD